VSNQLILVLSIIVDIPRDSRCPISQLIYVIIVDIPRDSRCPISQLVSVIIVDIPRDSRLVDPFVSNGIDVMNIREFTHVFANTNLPNHVLLLPSGQLSASL